jgi:hypothetical protein
MQTAHITTEKTSKMQGGSEGACKSPKMNAKTVKTSIKSIGTRGKDAGFS